MLFYEIDNKLVQTNLFQTNEGIPTSVVTEFKMNVSIEASVCIVIYMYNQCGHFYCGRKISTKSFIKWWIKRILYSLRYAIWHYILNSHETTDFDSVMPPAAPFTNMD